SSVSPTHAIRSSPPSSAALTRRATDSAVWPKYGRRSEWPTSEPATPSSWSIATDTSPVYAPSSAQCTFCANTVRPLSTAGASDVNGGQMTTSTPSGGSKEAQKARVSACVLNIFQLPAISIVPILCGRNRRHARQLLALEQLEGGAAARRDPRDAACEAELVQRTHRVTTAHHRVCLRERNRFGHRLRALREAGPLENAHRAVPEDRPGAVQEGGDAPPRLRPDAEAEPALRDGVVRDDLRFGVGFEGRGGDHVRRQLDLELEGVLVSQLPRHLPANEHVIRAP